MWLINRSSFPGCQSRETWTAESHTKFSALGPRSLKSPLAAVASMTAPAAIQPRSRLLSFGCADIFMQHAAAHLVAEANSERIHIFVTADERDALKYVFLGNK